MSLKQLTQTIEMCRAAMRPGDAVALCRAGGDSSRCTHRCPGPSEEGSTCVVIEHGDERTSEDIASSIFQVN